MRAFIQDNERLLDASSDLLKTSVYADNLVKVIENTPRDKVFTIGVFGGWGTGKSSIIRTAKDRIEKAHGDVKFITYDAWKYANDSFRRMFLMRVQEELMIQQSEEMSRFYQAENAEAKPQTIVSAKGLAIAVAIVAIISFILFLLPISVEWKIGFPTIGTLGSLLVVLLNGCFYDLKVTVSRPALFAPEQFEACFKEMMSKCLKRTNWFQKTWCNIKEFVKVGDVSVKGLEKLVIVIDNIDRCPSDMAYQLLTDIKTFLSNEDYNIVFVVPVDDEALKKHLFRKWNKSKDDEQDIQKEKEEFLRKFFNVTLRIKPHQEMELQHFAHEVNKENQLGYSNDTLAIVAKEFADNPRRIIQLLNNLSGDIALYENNFVAENETAICAALILREEYSDFYRKVTRDLNELRNFDEKDEKYPDSLKAFMRITKPIFKSKSTDVLQRVFTNTSSIFIDLAAEIQQAVLSYDAAKVIDYVKANIDKRETLVDFVVEKFESDVRYEATTQTTLWIDLLSRLFEAGVFDKSRLGAIDGALSPYYDAAVKATSYPDALCRLGNFMAQSGFEGLHYAILNFLKDDKVQEQPNFEPVLKAYYLHFTSEADSCDIAEVVKSHYIDNTIDQDVPFTNGQIKVLFGDKFVSAQIEHLPSTDNEARVENIIWCIKNNKELSGDTFTKFFDKVIVLFGDTRGKNKADFLKLLADVRPILDVIDTSRGNEIHKLFEIVTENRAIPNPNRPTLTSYDSHKSILEEVDEDEAIAVVQFCYAVMRISGGKVNISEAIETLYDKNAKQVITSALEMHQQGISIEQLAPTLVKADDYESEEVIRVLKIIFARKPDGTMMLNDEAVKAKIHTLVDNANISGAEDLLVYLSQEKDLLNIEAEYVASLSIETINSLPTTISRHAVSTFSRSTSDTYKDNASFLVLVLQQGKADQKSEVVRQMKAKIVAESDLDSVVVVLSHLTTENQRLLRSLISELENLQDSASVSDEMKSKIGTLVTKLSSSLKKKSVIEKLLGTK